MSGTWGRARRRACSSRSAALASGLVLLGLLAACSSPSTASSGSPSGSSSVTSAARYVDAASLVGQVAALVPKPTTVTSQTGTNGPDPTCPSAAVPCLRPSYSVDLAVANGSVTGVVLVTESIAALPDVATDPCVPPGQLHPTPGYHCVVTSPWTQRDTLWLVGRRVGATEFDCRQETVVRRGRTAVVVSERISQDSCVSSTSNAELPAAAPLDAGQVETLALATPLVRPLSFFTDVTIDAPTPGAASSGPVSPATGFWSPADGVVTQEQFVARAAASLPAGVLGEVVAPAGVALVPCGNAPCGGPGQGSADNGTMHAAFLVSRDDQAGLLVLGEDGAGSTSAVLNTCVGYRTCTQLVPWTQHGAAWTAVFENVSPTGVVDRTAYVVRGHSAFGASSQTRALRDDDSLATLVGAQPLLRADELLALVTALPLGAQEQLLIRRGSSLDHRPGPVPSPHQPQWPGPLS